MSRGQGVRSPDRCSSHFPRRNCVIDSIIEAIIEAIIDPVTEIPFTEFTRRFFHWRWCACFDALARD
jgi:hypothetical protein